MPAKSQQITLRGVHTHLRKRLDKEAEKRGWSLNRTVLFLLEKSTGLVKEPRGYSDLDNFIGQWNEEEGAAFDEALSEIRTIDPQMWT